MKKYKPSKSWLKEYYSCNKNIIKPDITEYNFPKNHLNFLGAELYLYNIIKILKKYGDGCTEIKFIKSQPCIYEINDYEIPYFWNFSGSINIFCNYNCLLNNKSIRKIKQNIYKLNEKFGYVCKVIFNDKKIYKF